MTSASPFPSDDDARVNPDEETDRPERTTELGADAAPDNEVGDESWSLFDQPQPIGTWSRAADGSDPGVLPVGLAATAFVAGMVAMLTALNGRLLSPLGLFMVALAAVLAYLTWRTRVQRVAVTVSRGIVYIESARSAQRFDLNSESTRVEVHGRPHDPDWQVRFLRRSLDPVVVTPAMVDPAEFLEQLRVWRTDL